MKLPARNRARRGAFTLVELMVVIVIIAIIAGLLTVAVIKALQKANQVKNQNEISQISSAMDNFKAKFGIYPPSRIILCENYSNYFNPANSQFISQLHADSVAVINRMFPRINWSRLALTGIVGAVCLAPAVGGAFDAVCAGTDTAKIAISTVR